jgi:hypothetical protein
MAASNYEGCFTLENIIIKFNFSGDKLKLNLAQNNEGENVNCCFAAQTHTASSSSSSDYSIGFNTMETRELLKIWQSEIMNIFLQSKNQPGTQIILLPENMKFFLSN